MDYLKVKFHFFISNNSSVCATIVQTEAIGNCHLSALHLLVGIVLLDESILFCQGMLNLVFNLQIAPWHLFVQPVSLSLTFPLHDSIEQYFCFLKKPADILRCHETTSEEEVQKFYTDDISLPRFWK